MKRWLFDNIGLKILALVITLILWAFVGSREILERKMTLRLELTDIPAGVTVDSKLKTSLSVILIGRKESVLEVDPEELKAVVSLKAYQPGSREMVVRPKVQPLPVGVTANVNDIQLSLLPPPEESKSSKKKQGK
jgi:YbbR domain-containing protein